MADSERGQAVVILHAAKLLTDEAQRLWEACVDNKGVGFSCQDCPAPGGVKLCRREWQDAVDTAAALRSMVKKQKTKSRTRLPTRAPR